MPRVTMIPAILNSNTQLSSVSIQKRKVAGYARVSTDSDEQQTSYEAQVNYYTNYIKSKSEWEFVTVYTDEGISALNTKKRDGFNKMIADALDGKIDLIITKSVSRFARNTVDSLTTIRNLKEVRCECYFEKENIWTFDGKGELLLTIMSSLAQEESRSISENVTWGQRKRFADGKVSMAYKQFLGYKKGENGEPEIVEEEAQIVKRIYDEFLEGKTSGHIAKMLTSENIKTPSGKNNWQSSTVESILTNEKYKGDALLQKTFTVDFLQKRMKVNEGEVPRYYVEKSHAAIIHPEKWKIVQIEFKRRKLLGRKYSGKSIFSSRIICGDCGEFYGSKVWNSNNKYRRTIWQCNHKFSNEHKCSTPHIDEEELKLRFIEVFNLLLLNKEEVLQDCRLIQETLTNCEKLELKIQNLSSELQVVSNLIKQHIDENAREILDQSEYVKRYENLSVKYQSLKCELEKAIKKKNKRTEKAELIGSFMFYIIETQNAITEFDKTLWAATVDSVTILKDGTMKFDFKNGISY